MKNGDFLNKSILDMTTAEKDDAIMLAKNLLFAVMETMTDEERERVKASYGASEVAIILRNRRATK